MTAMLMLMLVGVELFACELASPGGCEISSAQSQAQSDDCCLCCCKHVSFTPIIAPMVRSEAVVAEFVAPQTGKPLTRASEIYHPPQL